MKKRFWALFLVFAMVLTMLPADSFHAAVPKLIFRWCQSDADGFFVMDTNGNYVPDTMQGEMEEHTIFQGSATPAFFYYVDADGIETPVSYGNLKSSNESVITLSENCGSVMMNVAPGAVVGDMAYVQYVDETGAVIAELPVTVVDMAGPDPSVPRPGLAYRTANWDINTNYPNEDTSFQLSAGYGNMVGSMDTLFIYYLDDGTGETRLSVDDLTSSDSNIVSIEADPQNDKAVRLNLLKEGIAKINYTAPDGITYGFDVYVNSMMPGPGGMPGNPNVGFYTYDAAMDTYIQIMDTFAVTDTEKVLYMKAEDGWTFSDVELDMMFADIASYEKVAANLIKITVTGAPELSNTCWYGVSYTVSHDTYGAMTGQWSNIMLENKMSALMCQWTMWQYDEDIDTDIPVIQPENMLQNVLYKMGTNGDDSVAFYFIENGEKTLVTADQLTASSSITLQAHEMNPDVTVITYSKLQDGIISYTAPNGKTYSVQVDMELPEFGYYSAPNADVDTYVSEFVYNEKADENVIYYIAGNGWKFTHLELEEPFSFVSNVTLNDDKTIAKIEINGYPEGCRNICVVFDAENTKTGESRINDMHGIMISDETPRLYYRYAEVNNGNPVENLYHGLNRVYSNAPGSNDYVYFYIMVNGQEVNVPFKDLKVADDSVVELMATSDKNCAEVLAKDFGTTSFSYEKDGVVYEMEANVILPDVGFYTSASADKDSYIGMDAFAVTDTVKTVYMVAAGDWKFVTVEPNMNFKNVATYTINNAKNVVTITFFDSPNSDFWYDISYEIEIENESVMRGGNCHIHLLDKTTRLAFGEPGLEAGETGEFDTIWYTACGYMNDVEFYLVQGNTVVQKVSTDDLKVADDTILSVTEENLFESTDKITHMKAIGWGETEIQYVNAGNTYRVSVISELQRVGFYKDAQISQNNWFTGPLVATDKNNVVYLMAMDGYVFSNVKAGEACADYVDIKLSNNRDCVTVTINEYYEDFWLQIDVDVMSESCECDIDCNDGSGCMSDCWCNYCRPVSSSFGMEVQAGLCRHENTSIINAVDATCTETGYTGDTKCLDCGEIIKTGETYAAYGHSFKTIVTAPTCTEKGYTTHICEVCEYTYKDAEVDALGHDIEVKNAKAASCTEAGYTGDEVCEVCETVVTKGEVIEKLGHDTEVKDAKAATCTEAGYTGDEVCKVCETVVTKGEVIAKLGHDTEVKDAKAATCTTSGYTGDTVCKVCETVVEKGTIISAKGHTYENMVCTVCGDKMMVVEKVEDVDTSVPVEVVTPVVNQNAVDTATKETTKVIEAILAENVTEEIKAAVSEETIEAIKQAVEAGAQIAANIISNVVTEEQAVKEDVEEIKENIGETGTVAQYLDLSIMIKAVVANGEEVQLGTLNELTETITFPIIIPAELIQAGREFYVVRVHNGVADRLEVTKHMDGSYSFETDRFSTYALVYEDHALTEDKSPITSDMFMWICSVAIVAGCGVFVFSKKGKAIR